MASKTARWVFGVDKVYAGGVNEGQRVRILER